MPESLSKGASKESALFTLHHFLHQAGAQTPGADIILPHAAFGNDAHSLKVRQHQPLCPIVGMAYIIADHSLLTADSTRRHFSILLRSLH